jgi:hypothetical protein
MHYVTHRSHRMQKHKFYVTCPDVLLMETTSVPPEYEKLCVDVSWRRRTRMHYVNCRSHRMHKHKFDVTCLDIIFMETARGPSEYEK